MALSANTPRKYATDPNPLFNDIPVKANAAIYQGSALCDNGSAGVATALANAGTDNFIGFAEEKVTGTSADAGASVRVRQRGIIYIPVTGASAITNFGVTVYATDDTTFTLTATGGTSIGKVVEWVTSTTCKVYFEGAQVRSI